MEADELEVELVALGKAGEFALEPEKRELRVAALPIALGHEDFTLERIGEAPVGEETFRLIIAAAVKIRRGGLQGDELVGEDGVGLRGEELRGERADAFVLLRFEEQGEEEFQVVEIGGREGRAGGKGREREVGAAKADLGKGDEAAGGHIVGHAGEAGDEQGITSAVIFFLQRLATTREVVVTEAGAVVPGAERIEREIEVADLGEPAAIFHETPGGRGGAEPAGDGEGEEHQGDAVPENMVVGERRRDDADPEFTPVARVVGVEGLQFVFGEIHE